MLLFEQNTKQSFAIADRDTCWKTRGSPTKTSPPGWRPTRWCKKSILVLAAKQRPRSRNPRPMCRLQRRPLWRALNLVGWRMNRSGSIEDLIQGAVQQSANAPRTPARDVTAAAKQLAGDRLQVVLRDIEQAAASARNRPARMSRSVGSTARIQPQNPSNTNAAPVVIEVYKRPRAEVFHRRPGGECERDRRRTIGWIMLRPHRPSRAAILAANRQPQPASSMT